MLEHYYVMFVVLLFLLALALMRTVLGVEYMAFTAAAILIIIIVSVIVYGSWDIYKTRRDLYSEIQQNRFEAKKIQEHINAELRNIKELEYRNIGSIDPKQHEITDTQFYCERILGEPAANGTNINLYIYKGSELIPTKKIKLRKLANGQLEFLEGVN